MPAVAGVSDPLEWRNHLNVSYGMSDYFTFVHKIDGALRCLQRRYEQEQIEQDKIISSLKLAGWHPSPLIDMGEADSDDESGKMPPA